MIFNEGCSVCGQELVYAQEFTGKKCSLCGSTGMGNVECPDGHYVCDDCHRSSANERIEKFCLQENSTDPMKMAVRLMGYPWIKMHGPEHHYLVPAVLITSYYNLLNDAVTKRSKLAEARKRSEIVPGGYCGTHGACGAAVGAGIFVSIILGSTPLSKDEWSVGNRLTGEALLGIALHGGPRCCKRDSFIVIRKAVEFVREELKLSMPASEITCQFYSRNRQCRFDDCLFYPN